MKKKWVLALLLAALAVAFYAGTVLATSSQGFTGTTLAKATYGDIYSHIHTIPASWDELIKTKGDSDLYVQQNTWDPSACDNQCIPSTGWHTHPGHSLIIVTAGTVTAYDGHDPHCTPHVYTAGQSFSDDGGADVHMLRNNGAVDAETIAVQFLPKDATRRIDATDPGNCHF